MEKQPARRLDMTKIDVKQFQALLEEHTRAIELFSADLAVALGELLGHSALAKVLSERISDHTAARTSTSARLLDAAWRAASGRAQWAPPSHT